MILALGAILGPPALLAARDPQDPLAGRAIPALQVILALLDVLVLLVPLAGRAIRAPLAILE